jgi:hypothetical protein
MIVPSASKRLCESVNLFCEIDCPPIDFQLFKDEAHTAVASVTLGWSYQQLKKHEKAVHLRGRTHVQAPSFRLVYPEQSSTAELMLKTIPHVAAESCFALKGGTAINLFVRDMPRLSTWGGRLLIVSAFINSCLCSRIGAHHGDRSLPMVPVVQPLRSVQVVNRTKPIQNN